MNKIKVTKKVLELVMPNGVKIVQVLELNGNACEECGAESVSIVIPKYAEFGEFVCDDLCSKCIKEAINVSRRIVLK